MIGVLSTAAKLGLVEAESNAEEARDPWKEKCATTAALEISKNTRTHLKNTSNKLKEELQSWSGRNEEQEMMNKETMMMYWQKRNEGEMNIEARMRPFEPSFDAVAVCNTTRLDIPPDILMVLSWGPKFIFPTEVFKEIQKIPRLENMIRNRFSPLMTNEAMKHISNIIWKKKKMKETTATTAWLNFLRMRTTTFFVRHPETLVVNSDKGKHVVIMYETEYERKMLGMLSDGTTYQRTEDQRDHNIKRNLELINRLTEVGLIRKDQRYKYLDLTTTTSRIYGLPKIHKTGTPLRPITSTCNAPGSALAGLMACELMPFFNDADVHLRDSTQAKQVLDDVMLEEDEILVSFDVVSMFTNMPLELAKDTIAKKWREIKIMLNIDLELLMEILDFLLIDCAIFTYKDVVYRQIRGLAMGSPLSPLLARVIMSDLISTQVPRLTLRPRLLRVYVDDTIGIIKKWMTREMMEVLNSYHPDVQFTIELENEEGKINFLDITLQRQAERIVTNWYKKPFASDRLINYLSGHERQTILATATAHIKTVITLSDATYFSTNKTMIENRLRLNNFPETVIMTLMNQHYTLMRPNRSSRAKGHTEYIATPSIHGMNNNLKHALQQFKPDANMVMIPDRDNSRICSKTKDDINIGEETNVMITTKCSCGKTTGITRTRYQERCKTTMDRWSETFKQTSCGEDRHYFKGEEVKYTKGDRTYGVFMARSNAMAYQQRDKINTVTWEWPHPKMRKFYNDRDDTMRL